MTYDCTEFDFRSIKLINQSIILRMPSGPVLTFWHNIAVLESSVNFIKNSSKNYLTKYQG